MKRFSITLTAIGFSVLVGAAHAYTAVAFSNSTNKFGGSKNATTKEEAMAEAVANCKRNGGSDDCQVFKVSDKIGFASLHMACAGGGCGVTATTGRATQEEAHVLAKQDCEKQFSVKCKPVAEWEEKIGAESASNDKAANSSVTPRAENNVLTAQTSQHGTNAAAISSAEADFQQAISMKKAGNSSEYKRLLDQSAMHGFAKAQAFLGIQYMNGSNEYPQSPEKAVFWLQKSAEGGYADSFSLVAYYYYSGDGINPDWKKASYWYERAAVAGDQSTKSKAEESLIAIYSSGHAAIPRSSGLWDKAWRLAERGDIKMQVAMGYHYCDASIADSDIKQCVFWMEKAASKGDAAAQAKMGYANIYGVEDAKGNRLPLDYEKAIRWFELSAKQRRAEAMTGLGWTYEFMEDAAKKSGQSVGIINGYKNLSKDWHRKAAAKGADASKEKLCKRFGEWC